MVSIHPVHPVYSQLENRAGSDLPGLISGNSLSEPRDEVIVMGYPTGMRAMLELNTKGSIKTFYEREILDRTIYDS